MKFLKNFKKHFKKVVSDITVEGNFSLTSDQLYDIRSCFYDISDLYNLEICGQSYSLVNIKFDNMVDIELSAITIRVENGFADGHILDVNKFIKYSEIEDILLSSISYIRDKIYLKLITCTVIILNDDNTFETEYFREDIPKGYENVYNMWLHFEKI